MANTLSAEKEKSLCNKGMLLTVAGVVEEFSNPLRWWHGQSQMTCLNQRIVNLLLQLLLWELRLLIEEGQLHPPPPPALRLHLWRSLILMMGA